jgi:lipoprotein-anchoring transpeptidase ErfK/SrfK
VRTTTEVIRKSKRRNAAFLRAAAFILCLGILWPGTSQAASEAKNGEGPWGKLAPEITGGPKYTKAKAKTHPVKKEKGKKYRVVPVEDKLMEVEIIPPPAPSNSGVSIRLSLKDQRAWLYQDGIPVLASAITPGKASTPTPKGKYHVINRHRHWTSTIYGVPMPFFLRLNPGYFGLHQGVMSTQPASHGCIRLPKAGAEAFFNATPVGTPVWVE